MLHVEADQAITRKMTTNVFTEPYALFHENDLGAFLLFCIECYMSEAYQTIPPILIRRVPNPSETETQTQIQIRPE